MKGQQSFFPAPDPVPLGSLPTGFQVVYADPPWRYQGATTDPGRQIEEHYPTMDLDDLKAMSVDRLAPDAVLFMWATSPKLTEALEVLAAWGFLYRTCAVWIKDQIGMGHWVRQRHELLLIGVRGKPPTPHPSIRKDSIINAPRREHSMKPECVAEWIEAMFPQLGEKDRIELFCRTPRKGWTVWGNEV